MALRPVLEAVSVRDGFDTGDKLLIKSCFFVSDFFYFWKREKPG